MLMALLPLSMHATGVTVGNGELIIHILPPLLTALIIPHGKPTGWRSASERPGCALFLNQANQESVARYYQAADLYVHAAPADTFPNTVLEALACGTPVVATAIAGIPEQVERRANRVLGASWQS
jgi:glycosyltransferase involved in cell wall biosynthesis